MRWYWDFVLGSSVDLLVQLLGKRTEDEAELMESQFLWLTCVEVDQVVVLHSAYASVVSEVF